MLAEVEKQRNILEIQKNPDLELNQKNKLCQNLFMNQNSKSIAFPHQNHEHNESLNCQHYNKSCSRFYFECCDTIDPCHRCHLERGCTAKPPKISKIICNECNTTQAPSSHCINCNIKFSNSYCADCKIWTALDIHHCEHCGFCRVGKKEDVFHCHSCAACFSIQNAESHRCAKVQLKETRCPVCFDSVYTAQKPSNILPCGHVLHSDCLLEATKRREYRCPTCRKSYLDMKPIWKSIKSSIRLQPIPSNFFPVEIGEAVGSPYGKFLTSRKIIIQNPNGQEDVLWEGYLVNWNTISNSSVKATLNQSCLYKLSNIYCYDCEKKSTSTFHFLGLECVPCGSFNTCIS